MVYVDEKFESLEIESNLFNSLKIKISEIKLKKETTFKDIEILEEYLKNIIKDKDTTSLLTVYVSSLCALLNCDIFSRMN